MRNERAVVRVRGARRAEWARTAADTCQPRSDRSGPHATRRDASTESRSESATRSPRAQLSSRPKRIGNRGVSDRARARRPPPDHPGGRSERIRNFRGVRRHQAKRIGTRRAEPASTATTSTITRQPSPPRAATSSPLRRRGADLRAPKRPPAPSPTEPAEPTPRYRHQHTQRSTTPPSPPNRHPIRDQRTRHRHRGRPSSTITRARTARRRCQARP